MAKYHINLETGDPGICRALKGYCPFGGDDNHFATKNAALEAFEKLVESTPKPELSQNEIRFQKYTNFDELQLTTSLIRSRFRLNPSYRLKIKDRYGYGLGVHHIFLDEKTGEYALGKSYLRAVEVSFRSESLDEVMHRAAIEHGFHDSEKETIDWDAD